jgi:hypothetical protein
VVVAIAHAPLLVRRDDAAAGVALHDRLWRRLEPGRAGSGGGADGGGGGGGGGLTLQAQILNLSEATRKSY